MRLTLNCIDKYFGAFHVLEQISFSVDSGVPLGLLGRNGAGKSTTMRILMKIFDADSGTIVLDGVALNKAQASFGYLPEERGLYPRIKVAEQMTYFARLKGMNETAIQPAIQRLLKRLNAEEYAQKNMDTLSKGNQQKIQLAVALINDPDILVLDEPFSGLDPVNAQVLKELIEEHAKKDRIVIFSSHQMPYVEEFCQHIAIMHKGKIICNDTIDALKKTYPRNRYHIVCASGQATLVHNLRGLIPWVVDVSPHAQQGFVVTLKEAAMRPQLLKHLAGADLDVFAVIEPTLEEIFVDQAGDPQ